MKTFDIFVVEYRLVLVPYIGVEAKNLKEAIEAVRQNTGCYEDPETVPINYRKVKSWLHIEETNNDGRTNKVIIGEDAPEIEDSELEKALDTTSKKKRRR